MKYAACFFALILPMTLPITSSAAVFLDDPVPGNDNIDTVRTLLQGEPFNLSEEMANMKELLWKLEFDDGVFDQGEVGQVLKDLGTGLTDADADNVQMFSVTFDAGSDSSGTWNVDTMALLDLGYQVDYFVLKADDFNLGSIMANPQEFDTQEVGLINPNNGRGRALSHISFYGMLKTRPPGGGLDPIPEPSTALIWSCLVLGAVGAIRRRKS